MGILHRADNGSRGREASLRESAGNSGSPGCGEPSAGRVKLGETQSKQEGGFHPLQEESRLVALSQEE